MKPYYWFILILFLSSCSSKPAAVMPQDWCKTHGCDYRNLFKQCEYTASGDCKTR